MLPPTPAVHERYRGCLLGGAVGDALGAPVEFLKRKEILERFGPEGITRFAPAYGRAGAITDDTQMTLFTADGLLRAWVRGTLTGIYHPPSVVAHAYLRWLQTQLADAGPHWAPALLPPQTDAGTDAGNGWLFTHAALHSARAPGLTCLSALRAMSRFGDRATNGSKGCGGVMRAAPVGLFQYAIDRVPRGVDTFELGVETAAITHGHPTGQLTAGVLAVLIEQLLAGGTVGDALTAAEHLLVLRPVHEETLAALRLARRLAADAMPPDQAVRTLGEGWVAEEALAISVYCALVARDFRHGVIVAVNHDGDSDSTGAITGNLLGASHGVGRIPVEWLADLELADVIGEVADDLLAFPRWSIGEGKGDPDAEARILEKYPGV